MRFEPRLSYGYKGDREIGRINDMFSKAFNFTLTLVDPQQWVGRGGYWIEKPYCLLYNVLDNEQTIN